MLNSDNSSKDKCNNKEKMSIGELISYLRRTKGMTQKELGERLFVSDKTVSRWERGESLPELSLIPAIAGIFGITTDELLQGKLNDNSQNSEKNISRAVTNECELRAMLRNRARKYDNLSFISIGLTVLGILSAAICNIGLNEAYIGFFIAAAFISASEICQICFSSNAQSDTSGYDLCQSNIISESNMRFVKRGIYIDIFPLYGIGDDMNEAEKNYAQIYKYMNLLLAARCVVDSHRVWYKNAVIPFAHMIFPTQKSVHRLVQSIENICKRHDFDTSAIVGNLVGAWGKREFVKREYFGTPKEYKFESITVYGVEQPDKYLTHIYGDYMQLPPEEKRVSHHSYIYRDLHKSYLD